MVPPFAEGMMRTILIPAFLFLMASGASADQSASRPVVVTPLMSTTTTSVGQPIVLPQKDAEVATSIFDIAPGASLPVHKHPFPRYAYVLAGTLEVTEVETGTVHTFNQGDFIVEMVDRWHMGANRGTDPVKLLVIDQIEAGSQSTILRQ